MAKRPEPAPSGSNRPQSRRVRNVQFVNKGFSSPSPIDRGYSTSLPEDEPAGPSRVDPSIYQPGGINGPEQTINRDFDGREIDPYLGVPEGFRYARPNPDDRIPMGMRRTVHYRQSDLNDPFDWTPERRWLLQKELVEAGLLTGSFRKGDYDEATANAYGSLLSQANRLGVDRTKTLDKLKRDVSLHGQPALEGAGGPGGAEPPSIFHKPDKFIPNPEDLKAKVKAFTKNALGRDPSQAELGALIAMFNENYDAQYADEVKFARQAFDDEQQIADITDVEIDGGEPQTEAQRLVGQFEGGGDPAVPAGGGEVTVGGRTFNAPFDAEAANGRDLQDYFEDSLAGAGQQNVTRERMDNSAGIIDMFDRLIGGGS